MNPSGSASLLCKTKNMTLWAIFFVLVGEEGQRAFADAQALASGVASQIKMQAFLLASTPCSHEPCGFSPHAP